MNFADILPIRTVGDEGYTGDEGDEKSKSPPSIKEPKKTAKEGRVESISTDNVELKTYRNNENGAEQRSRDRRELKIITDKVGLLIAWCSTIDCHCCGHEMDSVLRVVQSNKSFCFLRIHVSRKV